MVDFSFLKREAVIVTLLLAAAFAVRLALFPLQGYQNDTATYSYWFNTAAEHGIRPFYTVVLSEAGWIDYPPFNVYIFWAFGSLGKALEPFGVSMVNLIKLAPTVFDLAASGLIYVFLRKQTSFKLSLLGMAVYAFNPAVIFNVAVWGQFDAIYTFFLVLSLMLALKSKPELSAGAFAIGLLSKPQGIALAPLVVYLIYKKNGLKSLLFSILVFAVTIFVVILPFEWNNPVTFLSNIYFGAYGGYRETTVNAFNLWGLFTMRTPDGNLFIIGWALFGAFTAFTLYVLNKRFNVSGDYLAIFSAFMLLFGFFMLPTRIHERYLFPAISILALMFPLVKKIRLFYMLLTATLFVNQAYVLSILNNTSYPWIDLGDPVVLVVAAINLIMFLYASILMWDEFRGRNWLKFEPVKNAKAGRGAVD